MAKPNTIPLTDYMLDCARKFQQDPEFESDELIYPLARLQKLVEEVRDVYRSEKSVNVRSRLHTHADRLMSHLELWKSSIPPNVQESGTKWLKRIFSAHY